MKLTGTKIAVGVIINEDNNLWQVWTSLDGNDVTCVSAHRKRAAAQAVANEFSRAYENEELNTPEKVVEFLNNISQDAEPLPFSEKTLQTIGREIRDAVRLHRITLGK